MPDRIALQRLTLGTEKGRQVVMPGEIVNLTNEQIAELEQHHPPAIEDPRKRDRQRRDSEAEDMGADAVRRVASTEDNPGSTDLGAGAEGQKREKVKEGRSANTTREPPAGDKAENDEL